MTLNEHIDDIRNQLKQGSFSNEAAVSLGIVLRLLEVLGWPRFIPQVIIPEYAVEGRRVDFALCHPPTKPLIFIEVKQVGKIEGAERQLFEYAFFQGVPIALLTDGREWHFFSPSGQGDFRERRVCKLDLNESNSQDNAERLNRYLNYEAVQSGKAVKAIAEDYRNASKRREIERRLPEAWSKLLQDEDEFLFEAMAGKTESLCGDRPTQEQILTFLKSLKGKPELKTEVIPHTSKQYVVKPTLSNTSRQPSRKSPELPTRLRVTINNSEVIEHPNASETFLEAIEKLGFDEVMLVAPTIVSIDNFPSYDKTGVPCGKYFIWVDTSTNMKKKYLERIARDLNVSLKVEIVDK